MSEKLVWCDKCAYRVDPDDAPIECPYWGCPFPLVRNAGDELGQVLGEALRKVGQTS